MRVLEKALVMLEKHPLCDHCLGRQFALLGHGLENDERGRAIKLALTFEAEVQALAENKEGIRALKTLATNGLFEPARTTLQRMRRQRLGKGFPKTCFVCERRFEEIGNIVDQALTLLKQYEYDTFLVGIELPLAVAEREDEFKAAFEVVTGESLRNEFGRVIGKRISECKAKTVDFKKPEIVILVDPFLRKVRLQPNPLFIAGRYKKLARGIPQSKWFCQKCNGRGCQNCGWTGKMYEVSVEEIIGQPVLDATSGSGSSFHGAGREDIDARMLGDGRPFAIEISKPRKRFLDLQQLEEAINAYGKGKVQVSNLHRADKGVVRRLKKGESTQKEYRMIIEFANKVTPEDLRHLQGKLANTFVLQKTPQRVLHRRADLTRERYIYDVNVKKLAPKKAELQLRCQGGLYVKELVTGDEGRTKPNVSEILQNKAKPMKLDVLRVIMEDRVKE